MFIVTGSPGARSSSVGAAQSEDIAAQRPLSILERTRIHESMPLLRSLADGAARVAINMALLTELSGLSSPLDCVKDACKAQRPRGWLNSVCQVCGGVSTVACSRALLRPKTGALRPCLTLRWQCRDAPGGRSTLNARLRKPFGWLKVNAGGEDSGSEPLNPSK